MDKFSLFMVLAIWLGFSSLVYATVGGPTLVYDLKFDSKTNLVYYTEQSYSGKGCPPELKAISLDTNTTKTVYSCDDGLRQYNYGPGQAEKINFFTAEFSNLSPIDLRKNSLSVNIKTVGVETLPGSPDYTLKTNFIADILQGGVKKVSIPFSGCSAGQPLIIDGYAVPGVEDKVVFLFSRKSDCFEGGYVDEFINLISGIKVTDGSPLYERKTNSPLVPHEGSLVAYAGEAQTINPPAVEPTTEPANKPNKSSSEIISVASLALAFLVGILLGRWKGKERVPTTPPSPSQPKHGNDFSV